MTVNQGWAFSQALAGGRLTAPVWQMKKLSPQEAKGCVQVTAYAR